jgi:hypothetical protein
VKHPSPFSPAIPAAEASQRPTHPRLRRLAALLFAPIHEDDESFPWRPMVMLYAAIAVLIAVLITLSFVLAWLVTGRAY